MSVATEQTAIEVAKAVRNFLARSPEDMDIVLHGVISGIMAAREKERAYASKCDQAMMAALALASPTRLTGDLRETLTARVAANLLPDTNRSILEKEAVERGLTAITKAGGQS